MIFFSKNKNKNKFHIFDQNQYNVKSIDRFHVQQLNKMQLPFEFNLNRWEKGSFFLEADPDFLK